MTATICGGGSVLSKGSTNPTGCTTNSSTPESARPFTLRSAPNSEPNLNIQSDPRRDGRIDMAFAHGLEIDRRHFRRRHPGDIVLLDAAGARAPGRGRPRRAPRAATCVNHRHRQGSGAAAGPAGTGAALHRAVTQSVPFQ